MNKDEAIEWLEKVYVNDWSFWESEENWHEKRKEDAKALHGTLKKHLPVETIFEPPHNYSNFYRIKAPLYKKSKAKKQGYNIYLQALCAVVIKGVEIMWHYEDLKNGPEYYKFYDLTEYEKLPLSENDLPHYSKDIIQDIKNTNLVLFNREFTNKSAPKNWPEAEYYHPNPVLRHYIFRGVEDISIDCT